MARLRLAGPDPVSGAVPLAVVLHGALAGAPGPDEADVLVEAEAVGSALSALGFATRRLVVGLDLGALRDALADAPPTVVFNLVEAIGGSGRLIHLAPAILDELGVAYTGSPTEAIFLSSNKRVAKRLLAAAGVPTPPWVEGEGVAGGVWGGPWIVKSVWEHASIGLDDRAVVPTLAEARARVEERATAPGGPWFAEAFIEGRELNVALIAGAHGVPEALPVAEIRFEDWPAGRPRLLGYAAKWEPESLEYRHTVRRFIDPGAEPDLAARLVALARQCWALLGLAGYARVDFRVDEAGRPWVLEVNANPCLSPDAGFAAALAEAGVPFERAVGRLVEDALAHRIAVRRTVGRASRP
jgi:D-alanine-D-alanine ligase